MTKVGEPKVVQKDKKSAIAIIGIGCKFPDASTTAEYWQNIKQGRDSIREVPKEHWDASLYFDPDPSVPDKSYAKTGGFLGPTDFDPLAYGMPPTAIEATDTSQILALVAAEEALRDAGYGRETKFDRERTSCILGVTGATQLVTPLSSRLGHPHWHKAMREHGVDEETSKRIVASIADSYVPWQENSFPGLLGNVVAGRIASRFDLHGSNSVVDAACASALAALHLAILELETNRADMVLTGGVDTNNDIFMYMCFSKTPALSKSGQARPFDEGADGTTLGEGIGIIVLKRLADAERDGDNIYAVIKGLGSSSDGLGNAIYTPSSKGQKRALERAYSNAGIDPKSVTLVEAHGTGTKVGDKVELTALKEVFTPKGTENPWCALGSVKSQIGHTKAAAGIAGLIKSTLALHQKVLPPTIKINKPVETLSDSAFYLNSQARPWVRRNRKEKRRSAISSFGFGGSNYHCVLEEYQSKRREIDWSTNGEIFSFSADDQTSLLAAIDAALSNTANFTEVAADSRKVFDSKKKLRLVCTAGNSAEDVNVQLTKARKLVMQTNTQKDFVKLPGIYFAQNLKPGKVAFVFPGQGSQYPGMASQLCSTFPDAMSLVEEADEIGRKVLAKGRSLSDFMFPVPVFSEEERQAQSEALTATEIAQPALGVASLASLNFLEHFQVPMDFAFGHSFGELSALFASGAMTKEDFFKLAFLRGRFMAECSESKGDCGSMAAVNCSAEQAEQVMDDAKLSCVLANRNSPSQQVISGKSKEINQAVAAFEKAGIRSKQLNVSAAFHSPIVAGAATKFAKALKNLELKRGKIPVVANANADLYPDDAVKVVETLSSQIANPVRFQESVEKCVALGVTTFVEVGPGSVLTDMINATYSSATGLSVSAVSLDRKNETQSATYLADAIAQLASRGLPVKLESWRPQSATERESNSATKKKRFTVPITGNNYRDPKAVKKDPPRLQATTRSTVKQLPREKRPETSVVPAGHNTSTQLKEKQFMGNSRDTEETSRISAEAFQLTQDNLRALQALQKQNAEVHQQFLEGQRRAQENYAAILKQHLEMLSGLDPNAVVESAPREVLAPKEFSVSQPAPNPTIDVPRVGGAVAKPSSGSNKFNPYTHAATVAPPATVSPQPTATVAPTTNVAATSSGGADFEAKVFEVIAEKTGYPPEMLEASMSLEGDLGIDSIKRVEIFSALQESLPAVSGDPEQLSSVVTLGDLVTLGGAASATATTTEKSITPPAASASTSQDGESLAVLLKVISEKSGYPEEMLDDSMALEEDLGIDSIKRVEIFSALAEEMPLYANVDPAQLSAARTIGDIVNLGQSVPISGVQASAGEKKKSTESQPIIKSETAASIDLFTIGLESVDLAKRSISEDDHVLVVDMGSPIANGVIEELARTGARISRFGDQGNNSEDYSGVVILSSSNEPLRSEQYFQWYEVLKQVAAGTSKQAEQKRFVTSLVAGDGTFGFQEEKKDFEPSSASGIAGLIKSAALEWPEIEWMVGEIGSDFATKREQVAAAMKLIASRSESIELGINSSGVQRPYIQKEENWRSSSVPQIDWQIEDVILVTGGARGVTAELSIELGKRSQAKVVLLGRSKKPKADPNWLVGITDERAMKAAIAKNIKSPTPAKVSTKYREVCSSREIRKNIERIAATGAEVQYKPCDISDPSKVQPIIKEIEQNLGAITAVVHGAGVLDDKLIADKTWEGFQRVFKTKVDGFENIVSAIHDLGRIKLMILLSSTTARLGRKGQSDYAIANEILNKRAQHFREHYPNSRVIAGNFGPWDGGMVNASLRKIFLAEGIPVIPLEQGARDFVDYVECSPNFSSEVLVLGEGAELPTSLFASEENKHHVGTKVLVKGSTPFLKSHRLGDKGVLPAAVMMEWMAEECEASKKKGLFLQSVRNFRVLNGLKLDLSEEQDVFVESGEADRENGLYVLKSKIFNVQNSLQVAAAEFCFGTTKPKAEKSFGLHVDRECSIDSQKLYENYLFHGSHFHGINAVTHLSQVGLSAKIGASKDLSIWALPGTERQVVTDPLVLDSIFQAFIVWSLNQNNVASLPSAIGSYRKFVTTFPRQMNLHLAVTESNSSKLCGDVEICDARGELLAVCEGVENVVSDTIYPAFGKATATWDASLAT